MGRKRDDNIDKAELALANRQLRRLYLGSRINSMRRGGRWILDRLHFGSGIAERIAAGLVVGAVFFLISAGICAASGMPANTFLLAGGTSLLAVVVTCSFLAFGPADHELDKLREEGAEHIEEQEVLIAELKERIAERQAEDDDIEAERDFKRRTTCPYCGSRVKSWTAKCPHCLEYLDDDLAAARNKREEPRVNKGVAAVLSFLIPGLGQIFKSQIISGIAWFVIIPSLYAVGVVTAACCIGFGFLALGACLHIVCVVDAVS